ncbi:MAG: hypothetical protein K0R78_3210 [Pelosinus sp.]|jgi:hypothetical protein|nr:hypothetical protein [Pelosinus sp.]
MNVLVIYDQTGRIFFIGQGIEEPIGLQFMYVDIPDDKTLLKIDVNGETHTPVFSEPTKSEVQLLKEENAAMLERISYMEDALTEFILGGTL